jgi:hypothetical protein
LDDKFDRKCHCAAIDIANSDRMLNVVSQQMPKLEQQASPWAGIDLATHRCEQKAVNC